MLRQLPLFVTRAGGEAELVCVDIDPTNGEKLHSLVCMNPNPSSSVMLGFEVYKLDI